MGKMWHKECRFWCRTSGIFPLCFYCIIYIASNNHAFFSDLLKANHCHGQFLNLSGVPAQTFCGFYLILFLLRLNPLN